MIIVQWNDLRSNESYLFTNQTLNPYFEALFSIKSQMNAFDAFKDWLQTMAQASIGDRIRLHRMLMLDLQHLALSNSDTRLHNALQQHQTFKNLMASLPDRDIPIISRQICILPSSVTSVYVVGDLHADFTSLLSAIENSGIFAESIDSTVPTIVFLGDYVDRGHNHLGLLECLLALKYLFYNQVVLLKGNHDGGYVENNGTVKTPYFVGEDEDKLLYFPFLFRHYELTDAGEQAPFLQAYLSFFDALPVICIWSSGEKLMMGVHGGIPRPVVFNRPLVSEEEYLDVLLNQQSCVNHQEQWYQTIPTLAQLTALDGVDAIGRSVIQNILWSDPSEIAQHMRWHTGRFKFLESHFTAFKKQFGIDVLFRGHVVQNQGLETYFDGQVYSVYSTGGQLLSGVNPESAYPEVTPAIVRVFNGVIEKIEL